MKPQSTTPREMTSSRMLVIFISIGSVVLLGSVNAVAALNHTSITFPIQLILLAVSVALGALAVGVISLLDWL